VVRFWADVFGAIFPAREIPTRMPTTPTTSTARSRSTIATCSRSATIEASAEPAILGRSARKSRRAVVEPAVADAAADRTARTDRPASAITAPAIEVVMAATAEPAAPRTRRTRFASGTQAPVPDDGHATLEAARRSIRWRRSLRRPRPAPAAWRRPARPIRRARSSSSRGSKNADKATMAAKEKAAEAERQSFIKLGEGDYQLPSIQLLNYDAATANQIDKTAMLELSAKLTQTLENYGVKGDVVGESAPGRWSRCTSSRPPRHAGQQDRQPHR